MFLEVKAGSDADRTFKAVGKVALIAESGFKGDLFGRKPLFEKFLGVAYPYAILI